MAHLVVLRPAPGDIRDKWTRIHFSDGAAARSVVAPFAPGVEYLVRVRDPKLSSLRCEGAPAREGGGAWSWLKASLTAPKDLRASYDGFDIIFAGERAARRAVRGVIRRLRRSGAAIDGPGFAANPELLTGWRAAGSLRKILDARSAAIVAHVYYPDIWPEILPLLESARGAMDIIVTVPRENPGLAEEIAQALPEARVIPVENTGRDIRPFLVLLEQGELDGYQYVCKIHAKKSSDGGRNAALGTVWRNRMLFDLLAAPGAVAAIFARFEAEPRVGMIGPRAYRYPSALCSPARSWGENRPKVLDLAARFGAAETFRLDFFCGTMFWVRPQALRPLRRLSLSSRFGSEGGAIDGALEHAVERLFSASVEQAGYAVEGISGVDLSFTEAPL